MSRHRLKELSAHQYLVWFFINQVSSCFLLSFLLTIFLALLSRIFLPPLILSRHFLFCLSHSQSSSSCQQFSFRIEFTAYLSSCSFLLWTLFILLVKKKNSKCLTNKNVTVNFITTWLYKFIDDDTSFNDDISMYSGDKNQHCVLVLQEVELVRDILSYTPFLLGRFFGWQTQSL